MTVLDDRASDLQRENADLRRRLAERDAQLTDRETELAEALAQQTATAEVLQVINSSPGDLAPVFDAMLEKALRLCEAAFGTLFSREEDCGRLVAHRNVPQTFADYLASQPVRLQTMLGPNFRDAPIVKIEDLAGGAAYRDGIPLARAAVDLGGIRSLLFIPLVKDGALIGIFAIYGQEPRAFSDKQIALLQNFGAQAVIAMENARLITETREALEQQTATAHVLQIINSSPGHIQPVFAAMLEKASGLCEAAFGILRTWDGEHFHFAAAYGNPRLTEWARNRPPIKPEDDSPLGRIAAGEALVAILDAPREYQNSAGFRAMAEVSGFRSGLTVALQKDGVLVGSLTVYRQETRAFSGKQVALLQNFAAQAVMAMENARLLGELRERSRDLQGTLEYQTAISDVLKVISRSTFELQSVLDTLVETAARLCEADMGMIATRDSDVYRVTSTFALSAEWDKLVREVPFVPGRGSTTGRAVLEGHIVHIPDIMADPEYAVAGSAGIGGIRANLGVPLLREGEPIGVIALARSRAEPFTERQIELVRTFADQAVIAIENARLLSELRHRTQEVAELNRGLEARVAEQVEELGRVGKLKRFLAPQLAELIVSQGDENILESHRREIVVVFCDLRGFTAFAETAEPEEVLELLREYHDALGPLVSQYEGTLDHFSGDGIMVFFNDPVPCPDPAERAVKMAAAMRAAAGALVAGWRRRDRDLGFGIGIAQGYATLGQIGFADRSDYTAIGTVCNLAARLCAEAQDGQILLSGRVAAAVEQTVRLEKMDNLALKGLSQPVSVFNVLEGAPAEVIPLHPRGQQPR